MISKKFKKIVMNMTISTMIFSIIPISVQAKEINKSFLKTQSIDAVDKTTLEYTGGKSNKATEGTDNLMASYKVKDGQLQLKSNKKLSKNDIEKHKIMWERVKQIIPKAYLNTINRFDVVTDEKDNTMAYVDSDDSNTIWTFGLNIQDAFDEKGKLLNKDLNETIVHEFGHIITLNYKQIEPELKENSATYVTDEGTTKKQSYLNIFYQKFWSNIYGDYKKSNSIKANQNDEQENLAFYEKYKNQFVSEYASTNPEEDIAECFRVFVFQNKPSGKTIAEKKVLLFYNFPELVKMRKEIRNNLKLK
ncbi:hypothetical protein ACJDU8_23835 [Clostridium sp. WILCCON 0269]|uniref:Uncharacterized protein n=1 Tax=Candidatus Clostridium eludens TaxID=3381663 RepID=A0ABW8SU94_9CLOT